MKSIVKIAKTVEEAINIGLSELGVERSDVEIEVIEEPVKRLFGLMGTTNAKVKLEVINNPVTVAENFVKSLFEKMNIQGSFNIDRRNNELYINIVDINSSDKGMIIGKRGNTLDSIQYLLSLVVNKSSDKYIRITLDTGDYRQKREDTLIDLAKKMAIKCKKSKRPVKLEPMNPYERRIIHSALQNDSGVKTYSEGEDPYRRIVIENK